MPTVETNGVRIHYLREGSGDPIVLLHGYIFGADWWRPQIDALRDRFDVVAVDLRGQMASETTEGGYELWNQAEDVNGVIETLGIAPVHCVGLSMGGMIAMRLALTHPEAVRSLVLMDTSAGAEDPEKAERYEGMAQVVEAGDLAAVIPALPPIFLVDDFIADHRDEVDDWLRRLEAADHMGLVRTVRAINGRDDITGRMGEIRVPTLVIHGEEDVAIPMERAEQLAAGIQGATLRTVSGAHQSNVDRPEETSRMIREFLVEAATAAKT
jgi:pimeloyl-ACP methyl ester carboxylesterase